MSEVDKPARIAFTNHLHIGMKNYQQSGTKYQELAESHSDVQKLYKYFKETLLWEKGGTLTDNNGQITDIHIQIQQKLNTLRE